MSTSAHQWKFYRSGGIDQVSLSCGDDLRNLKHLDLKLWMALAMPTKGIEFDPRTLTLMDTDADGRIRPPEILAAIDWADSILHDVGELLAPADVLALDAIKDESVRSGAKRILSDLGKSDEKTVSVSDISASVGAFVNTVFNGDGVIIPESAADPILSDVIVDIVSVMGGVRDLSGKMGVDTETLNRFVSDSEAYLTWLKDEDKVESGAHAPSDLAFAADAIDGVKAKVDDYFARCRLLAFDPRAADELNPNPKLYSGIAGRNLDENLTELEPMPVAFIEKDRPLPLVTGVNPAWQPELLQLRASIAPLFGVELDELSETDWKRLQSIVDPFIKRLTSKPDSGVIRIPAERLRGMCEASVVAEIQKLIEKDAALAFEYAQLSSVEKIVLFKQNMNELLGNFVNFSDFYSKNWAVFQEGTLYLDTRSCNLCIEIGDIAKHASLASLSAAYLAYCTLTRSGNPPKQIVAVFTDGDSENLIVGRNGVFYDRFGDDWDATIVKIVSNPISIREAFWMPYKKFVRMVEDQIQKRAAAADAAATSTLSGLSSAVANVGKTETPQDANTPQKIDLGTIALIGTAIGGISAMVAGFLSALFGLGIWLPFGVLGILLLISGPSMLLAWMKLRQRNLAPILDANGWAINSRARMNVAFGAALTNVAEIPPESVRVLQDPYGDKKHSLGLYLTLAVLGLLACAWCLGGMDRWLPERLQSDTVFHRSAEANTPDLLHGSTAEGHPQS